MVFYRLVVFYTLAVTTIDIGASMRHILTVDITPTAPANGEVQVSGSMVLGI